MFDSANALTCNAAIQWLENLTNGDIGGHEQTHIDTLTNQLRKKIDLAGVIQFMEQEAQKELQRSKKVHYQELKEAYLLWSHGTGGAKSR